jgi:hypothetical protein
MAIHITGDDTADRVLTEDPFALVAKQLGVRPDGWEQAVGDYGLDGHRSVADVVDESSLAKVRAYKQEQKRGQQGRDTAPRADRAGERSPKA